MATPFNFYYVYVLISQKDNNFYIGFTQNLKRRIKQHIDGQVNATKNRLPIDLIFFEGYKNKYDAIRREDYFKTTKGKRILKMMLKEYFKQ